MSFGLNAEQSQLLAVQSGRAKDNIFCEDHGFYPGKNPLLSNPSMKGCKSCVMATMMYDIFGTTPPEKRAERLAQLESLTKNLIAESQTNPEFDPDKFFNAVTIDVEHEEDEPASKG